MYRFVPHFDSFKLEGYIQGAQISMEYLQAYGTANPKVISKSMY